MLALYPEPIGNDTRPYSRGISLLCANPESIRTPLRRDRRLLRPEAVGGEVYRLVLTRGCLGLLSSESGCVRSLRDHSCEDFGQSTPVFVRSARKLFLFSQGLTRQGQYCDPIPV